MIAPIMVGSLFSWSLTNVKDVQSNKNPLGFPFNQYFPYFFLSLLALSNAVVALKLPSSLDKRKPKKEINENVENDEKRTERENVIDITITYFKPDPVQILSGKS